MTLGCGAIAGNITSDNIGPLHLINIKRIAYAVRKPEEAFEVPAVASGPVSVQRGTVIAAVEKYLASRGVTSAATSNVPGIVDRFLSAKKSAGASPAPPAPAQVPTPTAQPSIAAFVCENDVRDAMQGSRKIYVGPKTIVTPSARDLGDQFGILVLAQR
jgi:acetaldehyde dehydrogenase (acetylating)